MIEHFGSVETYNSTALFLYYQMNEIIDGKSQSSLTVGAEQSSSKAHVR
jgi:hypothetical protein